MVRGGGSGTGGGGVVSRASRSCGEGMSSDFRQVLVARWNAIIA